MIDRSRGLCRTAACATSQRAVECTSRLGPATPSTPPVSISGTVTGTSSSCGVSGRSLGVPPVSSIAERSRAVPTRSRSRSESHRRRSQSRRRGPSAVTSTAAGSGASYRRIRRSQRAASVTFLRASASSFLYSASWAR